MPPVEMRLLLQPEHDSQADRHFAAARAALKYYGTWFGPYPYPQLTIVDPVTTFNPDAQGEGTDGMEYPTLITAGTHWYNAWPDSWLEEVTIHEAGHQFWYGVVATNEFEHAWMDEGINTYATARVMQEAFPGQVQGRRAVLRRARVVGVQRRAVVARDRRRPADLVSPGRRDGGSVAAVVAVRDKCRGWNHLQQGGRVAGDTGAADRMAGHAEGAADALPARRIPASDARTNSLPSPARSAAAISPGSLTPSIAGPPHSTTRPAPVSSADQDGKQLHTVTVRRLGDGVFPVSMRVTSGGTVRLFDWDGRDRWTTFEFVDAEPVTKVEVDPDRVLLLDVNFTNNSWTSRPHGADAAARWAWRWLMWAQELMLTYAFVS